MSFKKRMLIGLPIAIAFYFIILSLMWAANVEDSYFQKLPEALVTFGTLMLALAAFWSIKNSNDQEKSRRKDELAKERREREEHLLDEIIDWAKDIHNNLFGKGWPLSPRFEERMAGKGYKDLRLQDVLSLDDVELRTSELGEIGVLIREGDFMEVMAGGIDGELVSLIHAAIEQMNHRRQLISEESKVRERGIPSADKILEYTKKWESLLKLIEDKSAPLNDISEEDQIHVKMARNAGQIKESADNIVKKSIKLKLSLSNL